jgi:hypothetical protein
MSFKSSSASRLTASSAVAGSIAVINTNTGPTLSGGGITANTVIQTQVVVVGSNTASSTTTASGLKVSNVYVTDSSYNILDDTALGATGGYLKITGTGFKTGCVAYINGSSLTTSFVSSTEINIVVPAQSVGVYSLMVFNTDGNGAIYLNLGVSNFPAFTTSAGSIGSVYETKGFTQTIAATGDSPFVYSLYSGSLPPGATLNANGAITGTSLAESGSNTYSFVVNVKDAQNQDTQRSFSLTINTDVVSWSSPANNTVYTVLGNTPMANVPLSAASAAGYNISYAANSLPTGVSLSGNTIYGTPTTQQTIYTELTATAATTNRSAKQYISWIVQLADPQFNYTSLLLNGETSATPFIADASTNNYALAISGDTKANKFTPYRGDGYYGNYFNGSTDYLSLPSSSAFSIPTTTTPFTIEAWVFRTATGGVVFSESFTGSGTIALAVLFDNGTINTPSGDLLTLAYYNGSSWVKQAASSSSVALNSWVHIACVFTGSATKIFVNGADVTAAGALTTWANTGISGDAWYVGRRWDTSSPGIYFPGYISNLRFVVGTAVYTSAFTPPTTPLTAIANTSLLTCQSNRFIDKSTNVFTVTVNGTPQISSVIPFAASSSYANYGSAYFDGTGDYLTMPASSAFSTTGDVTFECWVFPQSFAATSYILDIYSSTTTGIGSLQLAILTTGAIRWYYDATTALSSTSTLSLNTWAHLAFVRSSGTLKIYINGIAESTTASFSGLIGRADLVPYIGSNRSPANYFTGFISNFRITKSAVYTTNFTNPSAPLTAVANTQLLTLQYNGGGNNLGIIDNGPFNNPITRFGNATQGTFSPYSATGWSTYFSSSSYLQHPNLTAYSPRTGNFTLECWVFNTTAAGSNMWYVSHISGGVSLYRDTTGKLAFAKDAIAVIATSTNNIPTNSWVHLAVARSGTSLKLFINGAQEASVTDSTDLVSTGNFDIGITSGATGPMTGYISNVRLVTGSALYTAAFTPSTTPLTAISGTQFLGCQSNRFVDNSTNNAAATVGSAPSIQAFSPFSSGTSYTPSIHGGSMYLDGAGDYLNIPGIIFGTNPYTIELWFYATNFSAVYLFLATTGSNALNVRINNTTTFAIDQSNVSQSTFTVPTMSPNTWYHVAFVRNASNQATVFLNGVQSSTGFVSMTNNYSGATNQFGISGTPNYFPGYVSDVRVVNGAALYSTNFTPPTAPLTSPTATPANLLLNFTNGAMVDAHGTNVLESLSATQLSTSIKKYGSASMSFSGSGTGLKVAENPNINLGTSDFTIEFWVYFNATNAEMCVINKGWQSSSAYASYLIYMTSSGSLHFNASTNGSSWDIANEVIIGNMTATTWTHIAVTRSGTTYRAFINGTIVSGFTFTNSGSHANLSAQALYIGGRTDGNSVLNGYLDDVRITKGYARYTSSFTAPTAALLTR